MEPARAVLSYTDSDHLFDSKFIIVFRRVVFQVVNRQTQKSGGNNTTPVINQQSMEAANGNQMLTQQLLWVRQAWTNVQTGFPLLAIP